MNNRITIKGAQLQKMSDDEFLTFCEANDSLQVERLPDRQIVIHERQFLSSGLTQSIAEQLTRWSTENRIGKCVAPKIGFALGDGSIRNPAAAWMIGHRLDGIGLPDHPKIVRACPDFVIEVKNCNDEIKPLKSRMREWIRSGCKVAWLIDPKKETVHIFDPKNQRMHIGFDKPVIERVLLSGFQLQLFKNSKVKTSIWK